MQRRMGAIEEFEFEPLSLGSRLQLETCSNQLHITIAITGWLTNQHRGNQPNNLQFDKILNLLVD